MRSGWERNTLFPLWIRVSIRKDVGTTEWVLERYCVFWIILYSKFIGFIIRLSDTLYGRFLDFGYRLRSKWPMKFFDYSLLFFIFYLPCLSLKTSSHAYRFSTSWIDMYQPRRHESITSDSVLFILRRVLLSWYHHKKILHTVFHVVNEEDQLISSWR